MDTLRAELITSIRWNPTFPNNRKEGDWLTLDEPKRSLPEEFYQVRQVRERNEFYVHVYRRLNNTERLQNVSGRTPVQLPTWKLTQARIIFQSPNEVFTMFNPIPEPCTGWLPYTIKHGRFKDLELDLKEWIWEKIGHLKQSPFYNYSTKRGYKIIITRIAQEPKFTTKMTNRGYNTYQRNQFHKDLWHKWLPKKISTMIWLTCQEGLPLAQWRIRLH
jgi:hypothetical protein